MSCFFPHQPARSGEKILLYVEKFSPYGNHLLLDFVYQEHFDRFRQLPVFEVFDSSSITGSALLLENVTLDDKTLPQEGCVYNVPLEALQQGAWISPYATNLSPLNEEFFFAYQRRCHLPAGTFAEKVPLRKVRQTISDIPEASEQVLFSLLAQQEPTEKITVIVKKVGQGSWNEIHVNDHLQLVFDFGCSVYFSRRQCNTLLTDSSFDDHPCLIISHWDMDHYNLLKILEEEKLANFRAACIPPEYISLTSQKMVKKLIRCHVPLYLISPAAATPGARYEMDLKASTSNFALFCGKKSRSRNNSGLALSVRNKAQFVFFCADHAYPQLQSMIRNRLNEEMLQRIFLSGLSGRYHIVVPHHGGRAGRMPHDLFSIPAYPAGKALVSTGYNPYHHPLPAVQNAFTANHFDWISTDDLLYDEDADCIQL